MKYVFKKTRYRILFGALDILGNIIMFPKKMFRSKKISSFKKILIIRLDHIGDVINSTAVFKPLRGRYPEAVIDLLVSSQSADIVRNNKDVNDVICFNAPWFERGVRVSYGWLKGLRKMIRIIAEGRYDLCIDLRGDFRHIIAMYFAGVERRIAYGITGGGFLLTDNVIYDGSMHEIERNLCLLRDIGIEDTIGNVEISFPGKEAEKTRDLVKTSGIFGEYAVLHVNPGHDSKIWDNVKFAKVVRYIFCEKGFIPIIVGSARDGEIAAEIQNISGEDIPLKDLTGKTTLGMLYHLVCGARLFVGLDSAPGHIAASCGIPVVTIFSGTNDPAEWAPRGDNVELVYPGEGNNLSVVDPEDVFRGIDEILEKQV